MFYSMNKICSIWMCPLITPWYGKRKILKKSRPKRKEMFGIDDRDGQKWLTQLRVRLSPLNAHKFHHNFQDTLTLQCVTFMMVSMTVTIFSCTAGNSPISAQTSSTTFPYFSMIISILCLAIHCCKYYFMAKKMLAMKSTKNTIKYYLFYQKK